MCDTHDLNLFQQCLEYCNDPEHEIVYKCLGNRSFHEYQKYLLRNDMKQCKTHNIELVLIKECNCKSDCSDCCLCDVGTMYCRNCQKEEQEEYDRVLREECVLVRQLEPGIPDWYFTSKNTPAYYMKFKGKKPNSGDYVSINEDGFVYIIKEKTNMQVV